MSRNTRSFISQRLPTKVCARQFKSRCWELATWMIIEAFDPQEAEGQATANHGLNGTCSNARREHTSQRMHCKIGVNFCASIRVQKAEHNKVASAPVFGRVQRPLYGPSLGLNRPLIFQQHGDISSESCLLETQYA